MKKAYSYIIKSSCKPFSYQLHIQILPCFFASEAFWHFQAENGCFFVNAVHEAWVVEFFDVAIFKVGVEDPGFIAEVAVFDESGELIDGKFCAGFGAKIVEDEEVAIAQEVEGADGFVAVLAALKFADADEVEEIVGATIDDGESALGAGVGDGCGEVGFTAADEAAQHEVAHWLVGGEFVDEALDARELALHICGIAVNIYAEIGEGFIAVFFGQAAGKKTGFATPVALTDAGHAGAHVTTILADGAIPLWLINFL